MEYAMTEPDWDAVYWEQMPKLYNYFYYLIQDTQTVEDLTSQTLLRAWRYRHRYNDDVGAFGAWVFQIAKNVLNDHWRTTNTPLMTELMDGIAAETSVEQDVIHRQDRTRLYALIAQLSRREQQLIALKYGAEQTNRSIATNLDMTETNVGTTLQRIVRKLRTQWDNAWIFVERPAIWSQG
jgi:RNA polymerase sigma factor (sigma-70 family)